LDDVIVDINDPGQSRMQTVGHQNDGVMSMVGGRMGLEGEHAALCADFLGWQCRIRQMAVRHDQGRPSDGMRPRIALPDGRLLPAITVLITKREPEEITAQFRHMVLKTNDPADRYASAMRLLQAAYHQHPEEFSDVLSALFSAGAERSGALIQAGQCELLFAEHSQWFRIPAAIRLLDSSHPIYQATFWHNSLFNPAIPGNVEVLAFLPDWSRAETGEDDSGGR
jgi:hypothetical protein